MLQLPASMLGSKVQLASPTVNIMAVLTPELGVFWNFGYGYNDM